MTVDISEPGSDKKPGNRRTLSESDVRFGQGQVSQSRIEFAPNISSMTGASGTSGEICSQKRSHSLPHRYKTRSRNLSLTPTASPTSRPLRQPCYSPDEFHRGIQAMQSWFRNLDDSQRTLALQSITVRTTFLTARFILLIRRDFLKTTKLLQCSKPKLRNSTCKSSSGIKSKL